MSLAYAERHKVLPVQVSPQEMVVATSEPFETDWIGEVERQTRRKSQVCGEKNWRLHATPPSFTPVQIGVGPRPNLAATAISPISSSWLIWARTRISMPTTRAWCSWWIGCGSTRLSNVPVISIWEPRRDQAVVRFRIDGVLHTVYQIPSGVQAAMTARIKLLARMDAGAPPPARWAHQNTQCAGRRGGDAPFQHAHGFWRKAGDA